MRSGSVAALAIFTVLGGSPSVPAQLAGSADELSMMAWPGADRSALRIPDGIWNEIAAHGGFDGPVGYTREQMDEYGRDGHVMRSTLNLFGDARAVTRETGRISDKMLGAAREHRIADIVQDAYGLLGAPAGRGVTAPDSSNWGVDWIEPGTSPTEALEILGAHLGAEDKPRPLLDDATLALWSELPMPVQRLVVRMLIADTLSRAWIRAAIDPELVKDAAVEQLRLSGVEARDLAGETYSFGQALAGAEELWREDPSGVGHAPRPAPSARALLQAYDAPMMAYASVLYARHAESAIDEFRAWRAQSGWEPDADRRLRGLRFDTPLGPVRVLSSGSDRLAVGIEVPMEEVAERGTLAEPNGAALILDLGGDDTYLGRVGTPNLAGVVSGNRDGLLRPIAAVVDLGGDDAYDASGRAGSIACGLMGIGAIFDLGGDDEYRGVDSSISRALYGTSLLIDWEGSDRYTTDGFHTQAAAHCGVALLLDRAGDDQYTLDALGQGLGGTRGVGLLIDSEGDDRYTARDDGWSTPMYRGLSVSMAQGVGCGRRADFGDGLSLAGGWGLLLDGEGDDSYHATVWSQGAGYWWGVGVLEDRSGSDSYRNGWYSLGSAAHFSVGHAVDLAGSDRYNLDNPVAIGQYMGSARDGSIGIFIDGDGNDRAYLRNRSGGCGDLGSVGIFWSRRGNDRYTVDLDTAVSRDGALGEVVAQPDFQSFRDDLRALGVFLDTAGRDEYRWEGADAVDLSRWDASRSERERALGIDADLYPPPGSRARDAQE